MSILSVKKISKFYGNFQALNSVSLEVPQGSIYGLLGPNGAGKTSLIRIINQITAPDEGEVWFDGEKLNSSHISQIGYLPEERGLYPKMKVGEHLLYLAQLKDLPKEEAKKRIKEWLKRFEITDWWDKKIEELSKGMAQKIQFIATVIHRPKLLIFDEPFTGFDPINTELIKSEIRRLRDEGASVIFSTHRMESVEEICDYIALINKSSKILEGRLKDVKNEYKNNVFIAEVKGTETVSPLNGFEILDQQVIEDNTLLRIALKDHLSNELISVLAAQRTILRYEEEIPSLNEIFIQKVQEQ